MNQIIQSLIDRKSVRVFLDKPISKMKRKMILNAAINAPTAGNMQLYSIIDVTDQKIKDKLSIYCDNQSFIANAKMILIFLADYQKWYDAFKYSDCKPRHPEVGDLWLSLADATIACQNAVVAAESLGIGSCYIGDIIERHDEVCRLLGLPDYVVPACMVVFGYPNKQQKQRKKPERVDIKYTVYENKYHHLSSSQLKDMFSSKVSKDMYDSWIKAYCLRKYNTDFSKEMSNSMKKYLAKYR